MDQTEVSLTLNDIQITFKPALQIKASSNHGRSDLGEFQATYPSILIPLPVSFPCRSAVDLG